MPLLSIAKMGHPILRSDAKNVSKNDILTSDFQYFLKNLAETMREFDGVGLAATQVYHSLQVFVFEIKNSNRYPDKPDFPLTFVINPKITALSDQKEEDWEGCLSVPGIYGKVSRYTHIQLEGLNNNAEEISLELDGFSARVAQHEYDHLHSTIFIDRVEDKSTLCFEREYKKFHLVP